MGLAAFADKRCKIKAPAIRILFAEFIGTFILAVVGIGASIAGLPVAEPSAPVVCSLAPIAGGIGVTLGIYYAANVSGGHVNPAVTAAFWIQGRLADSFIRGTLLLLVYWGAQVGGAFCGAAICHVIYFNKLDLPHIKDTTCVFATCPQTDYDDHQGLLFIDQMTGTWILVSTVLALTDPRNANPPGLAPLFIGLSATAVGISYGGNGGGAINPARDFGPRLWAAFFDGADAFKGHPDSNDYYFFWIPIAGPIAGGLIAGITYTFFIMAHWPALEDDNKSTAKVEPIESPRSTVSRLSEKKKSANPYDNIEDDAM